MDHKELLHYIAPCSLFCYTCPALKGGAIAKCAAKLNHYFEGCYVFNDKNTPKEHNAWLKDQKTFEDTLRHYANGSCPGCRENPVDTGCVPDCVVPACVKAKGIDFCSECPDFPCQRAKDFFRSVNDTIGPDWEEGSRRLQQIGAQAYFEERKDVPHYHSSIKQA